MTRDDGDRIRDWAQDLRQANFRLRRLGERKQASDESRQVQADGPARLEELVPGVEIPSPGGSAAWVISKHIAEREPGWAQLGHRLFQRVMNAPHDPLLSALAPRDLSAEEVLFVDLETTGLQNSPLFLIGVMSWAGHGLQVRQYFARDYTEEPAAIQLFLSELERCRLMVSFNGRSFDWPYLRMRAAATLVGNPQEPAHLDLLLEARRVWRPSVPDCRLQTLEEHICGRPPRVGDIPGADIPRAYHDFVDTGDARQMAAVLEHNFLDLVTLAELLVRLPRS
ncbi:MAG: ribonuclease H-like domain-containing protein [Armatimonadetes bacterium]|nr:ribonuclease H-like domain-containing protein [Armatimonadota bacterium]